MQNIEKISSSSHEEIINEIEFNISTKIEQIISELIDGQTDLLKKMSYIVCGDCTDMKVYEIESFLLKDELSRLEDYQLAALWLGIEENAQDYFIEDNYGLIDELDIFNDVYSKIDFYEISGHSQEDFLKLLDKQCWLETKIQESNIFYSKLEDEVLSKIEYFDAFSILVPDFVTSFEEIQFFHIYGKDVESLTIEEYKKHLLYKLTYLISKNNINQEFFSDVTIYIESFEDYDENSEFYKHLPPIYFAKKIMNSEKFLFSLGEFAEPTINFTNLDSSQMIEVLLEYSDNLSDAVDSVLKTDIRDVLNYDSDAWNKFTYDNSEQRYDHDLSRFLQCTYTFEQNTNETTRLAIYNRLKEELEDEHNTIKSSIEAFLRDNFSEYEKMKDVKLQQENLETIEDINNLHTSDELFFSPMLDSIKSKAYYVRKNIKTIFYYSFWIVLLGTFIGYSMHLNKIHAAEAEAFERKNKQIQQELNSSIQQSVVKFNAETDWVQKLNKDDSRYVDIPVLTYDLERVWITEKPILFTGKISDIKIKNESEYIVIISRDFLVNKTNFQTDIELSVTASKDGIDSFIKIYDAIGEYSFDKGVAVIAKINSVTTQYLLDKDNNKNEVKTGNGKMLDIQFMGSHTDMWDN